MNNSKRNFFFKAYDLTTCEVYGYLHVDTYDDIFGEITKKYLDDNEYAAAIHKNPYGAIYYNFDIKQYLIEEFPYVIEDLEDKADSMNVATDDNIGVSMITEMDYRSHDKSYDNECAFVEGLHKDIDRIDKRKEITVDILKEAGFEDITKDIEKEWWMASDYYIEDFSEWHINTSTVDGKNFIIITLKKGVTNKDAIWGVHVDNNTCQTIGSVDISNVWQFNMFMKILDSKFRL